MPSYRYATLHKKVSEIRLIILLLGIFGTEIHVELETAVLAENQVLTYEAFSYRWGFTEKTVDVCIEGVG